MFKTQKVFSVGEQIHIVRRLLEMRRAGAFGPFGGVWCLNGKLSIRNQAEGARQSLTWAEAIEMVTKWRAEACMALIDPPQKKKPRRAIDLAAVLAKAKPA